MNYVCAINVSNHSNLTAMQLNHIANVFKFYWVLYFIFVFIQIMILSLIVIPAVSEPHLRYLCLISANYSWYKQIES
jgi:hypothetical protein